MSFTDFHHMSYPEPELINNNQDINCKLKFKRIFRRLLDNIKTLIFIFVSFYLIYKVKGPHHRYLSLYKRKFLWYFYWLVLGILSSCGLGCGLHTFILYLFPFIASVTIAAYECQSLNFPSPPYPDIILCPSNSTILPSKSFHRIKFFHIFKKIFLESFVWAVGTAIGELPPYFVAKAGIASFSLTHSTENSDIIQKLRHYVELNVEKFGFWGILICASIPNPLFDFAGFLCGYSGVSFFKFFTATLIGKSIIKIFCQVTFVIFLFSDHLFEKVLSFLRLLPYIGLNLEEWLEGYLENQKSKMHNKRISESGNAFWYTIYTLLILYFIISVVDKTARNYHRSLLTPIKNDQNSLKLK